MKTTTSMSSFVAVVPFYIGYRIGMVDYSPMMDCDEIYNYWEPLHYMIYHNGFQTWEYHYDYALRTYSYLIPLQVIAKTLLQMDSDSDDKTILFLRLRQSLAAVTACCELFFIYALLQYFSKPISGSSNSSSTGSSHPKPPSRTSSPVDSSLIVPYGTALLLLTCTGMNHSASALLPSATWISIWCVCSGCFLLSYHRTFIAMAIIGTLTTGWPFGCICIVPMSIHIVYKEFVVYKRPFTLIMTILLTTIIVQSVVTYIDTMYYATITFPTYNIFLYNAGESNDTLYGIEPISYYIKNLFLNCNLMAVLGCLTIPIYILISLFRKASIPSKPENSIYTYDATIMSLLLSLPIWFLITLPRPHKEERFMYPIYPVLVFGSVVTMDILLSFLIRTTILPLPSSTTAHPPSFSSSSTSTHHNNNNNKFLLYKWICHVAVWVPIIMLSLSRTFALYKYYHAPIDVYNHLSSIITAKTATEKTDKRYSSRNVDMICTCGEWYRYPSSFYIPERDNVHIPIGFLPSSFTGQLPQPYTIHGSKYESIHHVQSFNDRNMEEKDRYVQDIGQCTYLIDVSDSNDCRTQFDDITTGINIVPLYSVPFLDTDHTTSLLHRILYIPLYHEYSYRNGQVTYKNYTLYGIETKM